MQHEPDAVGVVTGAGEGLGTALARKLADAGLLAVLVARDRERLAAATKQISENGGRAIAMTADLRDASSVRSLFDEIASDFGVPEIVIYNAGAQYRQPILDTPPDMFEKVWRLSCLGGFLVGREAARHMITQQRGTIIFTGATASLRGGSGFAAFSAAKFGLRAVAQSMARELGPKGIHVAHVVIDGAIDMPRIHSLFPGIAERVGPDGMLAPDAVADAYVAVHNQPRSAWTFETDLRPWAENF